MPPITEETMDPFPDGANPCPTVYPSIEGQACPVTSPRTPVARVGTGWAVTMETVDDGAQSHGQNDSTIKRHSILETSKGTSREEQNLKSLHDRTIRRAHVAKLKRDRFIPVRRPSTELTKGYRTNKPIYKFNQVGRPLRDHGASPDPFGPFPPSRFNHAERINPVRNHQRNRPGRGATSPTRLTTLSITLPRDYREASVGSVWNVGGSAAAMEDPVTGRTNVIHSSSSQAPVYWSNFLQGITPDEEIEAHETRLAAALDMDQAGRILDFTPSTATNGPSTFMMLPNNGAQGSGGLWTSPSRSPRHIENSRLAYSASSWLTRFGPSPKPKRPLRVPNTPFR